MSPTQPEARAVIESCGRLGWTLATAESLTGGLVCAALTDVPGASAVVRGGVVSYATAVKHEVLGVPTDLLAARGAVDPEVALAMAEGVCRVLDAVVGVATTGVAGPDPAEGKPVGTVHVAVHAPGSNLVESLLLTGDRATIRAATVMAALRLVSRVTLDGADR